MKPTLSISTFAHRNTFSNTSICISSTISQTPHNTHNRYPPLCPKCFRLPFIYIIPKNVIEIKCPCGYNERLSLKNYKKKIQINYNKKIEIDCSEHNHRSFMYYCNQCKQNICEKCLQQHKNHKYLLQIHKYTLFEEEKMRNKLNNAYNSIEMLDFYQAKKNEIIQSLLLKINEIEAAYEECITNNKIIYSIIEQLIESYNREKPNFLTVTNLRACYDMNPTKLFKNTIDNDCNNAIHFFRSFSIMNNNPKDYLKIKEIKKYNAKNLILSLLLVDDNHLAVCGNNKYIDIINLTTFQVETQLSGHTAEIWSMALLNQSTIISCSSDKSIIIWNKNPHIIKNAHENKVLKVIVLTNHRFASSSSDCTIKIWKDNSPYNLISTLTGHTDAVPSILQLTDVNNILVSCSGRIEMILKIWDIHSYKLLKIVENIHCSNVNCMLQLEDGRIVVGGDSMLNIINTVTYQVDLMIENDSLGTFLCIFQIGNHLLIGSVNKKLYLFDIEKKKKFNTSDLIKYNTINTNNVLKLADGTLITSTYEGTISLWKV